MLSLLTLPASVWPSSKPDARLSKFPIIDGLCCLYSKIWRWQDKLSVNKTNCTGLDLDSLYLISARKVNGVTVICAFLRFRHPHSQNRVVIWVFPSHITFAIWFRVKVRVTGDVHTTWGMGMPKDRGCQYHCDTGIDRDFRDTGAPRQCACFQHPSWRQHKCLSSFLTVHIFFASCEPLSWIVGTAAWYFIVFLQNVTLSSVSVWCNVRVLQGNGSNRSVSLIPYFSC